MADSKSSSFSFSNENMEDLCNHFKTLNRNGTGHLDVSELKQALEIVGFRVPQWQIRQILDSIDKRNVETKGQLSFSDFQKISSDLQSKEVTNVFKTAVYKRENVDTLGGMSEASNVGTTHSVRHEEQVAFSDWINSNLRFDPDLKHLLPIDNEGKALYDKMKDGILLCKIINHSCPNTIDERVINTKGLTLYTKHENLTLALNSSQAIGCNVINIDAHDLSKGKQHLVLGLLWQIIRIGLFNQISHKHCPGLVQLLHGEEQISDVMKLSPENILLRWVNFHLEKSGSSRRISNFTSDIKDSEAYSHLLKQIAPLHSGVTTEALSEPNMIERAEIMLKQADKIGCRSFLTPKDVVEGVYKLNVAFVANLFNKHASLEEPAAPIEMENIEETREEKTYRNWMNSMGVSPFVNWLYSDLADGLIIFQLYDVIQSGTVDWNRVHKKFSKLKGFMEKLENCNYVVKLGKEMGFRLVSIAGNDVLDGNRTLTLGLVWQLMRAYTLTVLTQLANTGHPVVEKEIVDWANAKLKDAGKETRIKSFQDPAIASALPVIDLIDSIQPGCINYSQVLSTDNSEDKMANAKYAISMARKIGTKVYALPEDITEVKAKMVMTVFACLMARDYIPNMNSKDKIEE